MKKGMIFCFCILAALLCASCVKHAYPQALVEADSLCYTNPQVALKKLQSIRRGLDTTNTADWMYYRFVKLKAQEKAYVPHSDLANINQLITYYEGKGDKTLLSEVYYFAGSTYFDLHDSPQALDYYHKVLDLISAKSNLRLWGLAHAQIGYVMLYQGNYPTAIEHFRESYLVDSIRRDTVGMIYDLRDLSYSYSSINRLDSVLFLGHKALGLSLHAHMPEMITSARSSLANIYVDSRLQNLDSASKYVLPMLQDISSEDRSGVFSVAMKYYKLRSMPDSVNYFLKKIMQFGEIYAKYSACRTELEMKLEKDEDAQMRVLWKRFVYYDDSIKDITKTEAISKSQGLYDYTQRVKENARLKAENEHNKLLKIILGLSVFIVIILFYVYFVKNKYEKENQQRQMEELKHLLNEGTLQSLLNKENLCKFKKTEIYAKLLSKIDTKRNMDYADWIELDNMINKCFTDFKLKLYRVCKLSELEYQVCMLLKIEIPLSDISIIVHREPSALTMSRKRLYKKLFQKEGKADELDSFIRSI